MIRSALTEQFGIVLEAEPGDHIDGIETGQIRDLLLEESGGAVLFRGFDATEETFKSFTERHGAGFVVHHNLAARDYVGGDRTFATVNKGDYAIDFHNEMASDPISPDVFWMFAAVPARERGRTGLADGVAVAKQLTDRTRRLFSEKPLLFEYTAVPKSHWSALLPGKVERSQVEQWLTTVGRERGVTEFSFDDAEQLSLKFVFRAIRPTRLSGMTAFCCGLLDAPEEYRFDDGSRPDSPAVVEVAQATYQNALWMDWQAGDLVVIDNTRVMHAREAFDDPDRRILVRYSGFRQ
jgi:alpha-ketoglutarate-dependent taurine dioxygenase